MGHKKWWFTLSGIIIAVGLISLFVQGRRQPRARSQLRARVQGGHAHLRRVRASRPPSAEVRQVVAEAGLCRRPDPADAKSAGVRARTASRSRRRRSTRRSRRTLKHALDKAFGIATDRTAAEVYSVADRRAPPSGPGHRARRKAGRPRAAAHPRLRHLPLPVEVRRRAPSPPRSTTCSSWSASTRSPAAR